MTGVFKIQCTSDKIAVLHSGWHLIAVMDKALFLYNTKLPAGRNGFH
jgi:hypothetical protein